MDSSIITAIKWNRYNEANLCDDQYGSLTRGSQSVSLADRKDRVFVQLPKFPPQPTSSDCSSPLPGDLSQSLSVQTVMSILQARPNNDTELPVGRALLLNQHYEQVASNEDHKLSKVKMEFDLRSCEDGTVPPDLLMTALTEKNDGLRCRYSQANHDDQELFADHIQVTPENSTKIRESTPNSENLGELSRSGKFLNNNTFASPSERISRLDDVVAELSTKMLQLRSGSSYVLLNLERTMQLLTQVRSSLETSYRCKTDCPKVNGFFGCNNPTPENNAGTHKSNSTAVSDISQDSVECSCSKNTVSRSPVTENEREGLTTNPSRSKSQQWDPTTFPKDQQVDRCLTTSQSTYEVSGHLDETGSTASPGLPPPSATNGPNTHRSGSASPFPKQKSTRRSALQLAAAIFRTSSRDRSGSRKFPSQNALFSTGSGKFFKRRSLSKESTTSKSTPSNA